jgi:hypothetical protein
MKTGAFDLERRKKLVTILRLVVLAAGVYQLLFGRLVMAGFIGVCLLAIIFPGVVTRGRVKALPLEFELILFIMVTLQFVIGETLNFYNKIPYFDKLVHFSLPFFMGYIIALLAYTMYATGNLRASLGPAMVIIVLVSLGVGAVWEIIEYLSDVFLHTYLQGSLTASPLVDTMHDLIVDTLGGIFGAIIALRYIRSENRRLDARLPGLVREIETDFGEKRIS